MSVTEPTPERILALTSAAEATALLGTAVDCGVFTRLEAGAMTADALAEAVSVSPRGAQALLDGLVALRLVTVSGGKYANTPDASAFLVEGKPSSLTDLARAALRGMADWANLPRAVKAGAPLAAGPSDAKADRYWATMVTAMAPLVIPVARAVVVTLGVGRAGPTSILDIGGGSGAFSAVLLEADRQARATQIDWPSVNAVARTFVDKRGVGDRFLTVNGDLRTTDFGANHDLAIYSNVARYLSAAENLQVFRRVRKALAPTGVLVINDCLLRDDRSGPPDELHVQSRMLLGSKDGEAWRVGDYRRWLTEAGFGQVSFVEAAGPSTLIYASASSPIR